VSYGIISGRHRQGKQPKAGGIEADYGVGNREFNMVIQDIVLGLSSMHLCTCSHVPKSALKTLLLGISYAPSTRNRSAPENRYPERHAEGPTQSVAYNSLTVARHDFARKMWEQRLAGFLHHGTFTFLLHRGPRDTLLLHLRPAFP